MPSDSADRTGPVGAGTTPVWRTGVLWGLLALLLVAGTVALAFAVFAVTVWIARGAFLLGGAVALVSGAVAFLAFLFMAGILYRVDRYRGQTHRVVRLFE
ncbi:MAG: hypothetical protein QXG65_00815 [Thermoplasmata archaeon]